MADGSVIVDNVLCFLIARVGNSNIKLLKSAVLDFYSYEDICRAKNHLIQATENMKSDIRLPHIPMRREGELRAAKSLDDIMTIFTCLDENIKMCNLPKYVAESPDVMPSMRLYDGDLRSLMMAFDKMSERLEKTEAALAAILKAVSSGKEVMSTNVQSAPDWPPLPGYVQSAVHSPQHVRSQAAVDGAREVETVFSGDFRSGYEWASAVDAEAAAVSTPVPVPLRNRFTALGSTTDDDERQQFRVVQSRRTKRSYRQTAASATNLTTETDQTRNGNNPTQRRRVLVYGKSTDNSAVTAAERKRKKAVFCIDNVNISCTTELMKSFVKSMGVEVFTCFEAKSRRRRDENDATVYKRKAFRVCICEDDIDWLLKPCAWPDSIVISEWFFKQSTRVDQNTVDKRRRIGSDESNAPRQPKQIPTQSQGQSSSAGVSAGTDVEVDHGSTTTVNNSNNSSSPSNFVDAAADDGEHTVVMSDDTILATTSSQDGR